MITEEEFAKVLAHFRDVRKKTETISGAGIDLIEIIKIMRDMKEKDFQSVFLSYTGLDSSEKDRYIKRRNEKEVE